MTVEFIGDLEKIRAMKLSQVLGYVRDILLDQAAFVSSREESAIKRYGLSGWHPSAMSDHDACAAAALALEKIIAVGKDAAQRGVKLPALVESVVDTIRSCLIHEITLRDPSGSSAPKTEEVGDVSA